jgi:hypothetical protein
MLILKPYVLYQRSKKQGNHGAEHLPHSPNVDQDSNAGLLEMTREEEPDEEVFISF